MQVNNQSNKFSNITKKHIKKKSRNSKLKEKYYINEKPHLATEKNLYFFIPWKLINEEVLISSGGSGKNWKINKRPPRLLGT